MERAELALKAELPLISIRTTDTINVKEILQHLVGDMNTVDIPKVGINPAGDAAVGQTSKYILMPEVIHPYEAYYHWATKHGKILIFVNLTSDEESPLIFDAGILPTPHELVVNLLGNILEDEDIDLLLPALGGLTLKDIGEICRLAMTKSGELSPRAVMDIRRMYASNLPGIEQVDSNSEFYIPLPELEEWVEDNAYFFLKEDEPRLIPRGILADGPPGTGKTEGAKYIAREWGIPLYRLDIAGMMNKWLGEAEGNLKQALGQIEQEAPCVLLIDEVEKLFNQGDSDGGATSRMLSQLLWWLQAHRERILSVMTTNDREKLPPELYRPGRIDTTLYFKGVNRKHGLFFITTLLGTLPDAIVGGLTKNSEWIHSNIMSKWGSSTESKPQAELTQMVYEAVKKHYAKTI